MARANQYRPNDAKTIHKAGANDKQPGTSLDKPLSTANFLLMLCKGVAKRRAPKAQPRKWEQLIANHFHRRDGCDHQRKFQQSLVCGDAANSVMVSPSATLPSTSAAYPYCSIRPLISIT